MHTLLRLWSRLPALVRGSAIAFAILIIGQLPPGLALLAGLRYTPRVPWWLAITAAWLWLFWSWLKRRDQLRAPPLPARVWLWSMAGGGAGMIAVLTGALLTGRIATLPAEAYAAPFDVSRFPWWTVAAYFLSVAATAGVVEEAAFRGYMLSIVERRHGWTVAIVSVAILFYLVHVGHAYATVSFAPFFFAYSLLHGLLVFLTRSIRPSVVLHTLGDLTILPIQYGVLASPLGSSIRAHLLVMIVCGGLAALGLSRVHALERERAL